jgi:transcriptional regulator with XRE-family HTH domain
LALANILDQSSTSFIARIELRKDGHNYSFAHLLMIAKALNIDIKDLIPSSL